MFAAVAAGVYPDVPSAQRSMGSGFEEEYVPDPEHAAIYDRLYEEYLSTGEFIERSTRERERNREQAR